MAEQITNPVSYGGRAEQMAIGKGITDALNKTRRSEDNIRNSKLHY